MSYDMGEVKRELQRLRDELDPKEDYLSIVAAEKKMEERAKERKMELEEAYNNLKALSRIRDAARASAKRPPTVPSAEGHAENLHRLDAAQIALQKAVSDTQSTLTSREDRLAKLKEEARELELADPAGEAELTGTILRLQLIKSLGFSPTVDSKGRLEKVLVRGTSGEIYIAKQERGERDVEFSERLWTLASK
ncbi:hypothetical protein K488DRAFT_82594 [Vararia minispora EC-137]|uniref:Uncharacterized protein n=1 Tax=Vararia minispora EC-137 TaxID=1314806 RepID=A0ACB8QW00_9AGAM|nr:hypothetical protein K488DRAFT_82594 [Vararia minispora EC-137]